MAHSKNFSIAEDMSSDEEHDYDKYVLTPVAPAVLKDMIKQVTQLKSSTICESEDPMSPHFRMTPDDEVLLIAPSLPKLPNVISNTNDSTSKSDKNINGTKNEGSEIISSGSSKEDNWYWQSLAAFSAKIADSFTTLKDIRSRLTEIPLDQYREVWRSRSYIVDLIIDSNQNEAAQLLLHTAINEPRNLQLLLSGMSYGLMLLPQKKQVEAEERLNDRISELEQSADRLSMLAKQELEKANLNSEQLLKLVEQVNIASHSMSSIKKGNKQQQR